MGRKSAKVASLVVDKSMEEFDRRWEIYTVGVSEQRRLLLRPRVGNPKYFGERLSLILIMFEASDLY